MSTEAQTAKQPKRARGKARVAALLDAAGALFAEKGYEATTMTEIAQRAGAAIGSLYQFFPSKEALAEALVNHYIEQMGGMLDELALPAARLGPAALADALVDLMLKLRAEREVAMKLLNTVSAVMESRRPPRHVIRGHIAGVLRAANPALEEARAIAAAMVITHLTKSVPQLVEAEELGGAGFVAEARRMLRLYLEQVLAA
jgi:AcrR family transcriptional regulator